jgi:hypothetical protein
MYAQDTLITPNGTFIDSGATLQGSGNLIGNVWNSGTIHILLGAYGTPAPPPPQGVTNVIYNNLGGTISLGCSSNCTPTSSSGGGGSVSGGSGGGGGSGAAVVTGTYFGSITSAGVTTFEPSFNGLFTVQGAFTQTSTGEVIYDIGGASNYAMLDITGHANLEGKFVANLVNGYTPTVGTAFDVFEATGGITIGTEGLAAAPAGWTYSIIDDDTTIAMTYEGTPVPVPAAAWLMVSGLGGLGLFAANKRRASRH